MEIRGGSPPSRMFRDAMQRRGEGVAPQVKPTLSFLLLWERPQCLLQQEETEGQSTDLLSSCPCDRRLSISLYYLCLKHTLMHTSSSSGENEKDRHVDRLKSFSFKASYGENVAISTATVMRYTLPIIIYAIILCFKELRKHS